MCSSHTESMRLIWTFLIFFLFSTLKFFLFSSSSHSVILQLDTDNSHSLNSIEKGWPLCVRMSVTDRFPCVVFLTVYYHLFFFWEEIIQSFTELLLRLLEIIIHYLLFHSSLLTSFCFVFVSLVSLFSSCYQLFGLTHWLCMIFLSLSVFLSHFRWDVIAAVLWSRSVQRGISMCLYLMLSVFLCQQPPVMLVSL